MKARVCDLAGILLHLVSPLLKRTHLCVHVYAMEYSFLGFLGGRRSDLWFNGWVGGNAKRRLKILALKSRSSKKKIFFFNFLLKNQLYNVYAVTVGPL